MKSNKKIFKKIIRTSLLILVLLILSIFIQKIYITSKCKNFDYSVNYYLTNSSAPYQLLRVQDTYTLFSNQNKKVIKAYGLSKDSPHKKIALECHFIKDSNGIWKLENSYLD